MTKKNNPERKARRAEYRAYLKKMGYTQEEFDRMVWMNQMRNLKKNPSAE